MGRTGAALALTLAFAGCSLTADLSGFSSAPASGDAAPASDAATVGDAATFDGDGGPTTSPDAGPFCARATGAAFCDDFDQAPLAAFWTMALDPGASVVVNDASAVSAPNALLVTMPLVAGTCKYAYATHTMGKAYAKTVRMELDVRFARLSQQAFASTSIGLGSTADGTHCDYYFATRAGSTSLVVEPSVNGGAGTVTYPLARAIEAGPWTHVAFAFDTAQGATPTVTVSLDGVVALDKQAITPPSCGFGTVSEVGPGLYCVSGNDVELDVRTDNVVVWTD